MFFVYDKESSAPPRYGHVFSPKMLILDFDEANISTGHFPELHFFLPMTNFNNGICPDFIEQKTKKKMHLGPKVHLFCSLFKKICKNAIFEIGFCLLQITHVKNILLLTCQYYFWHP